MRFIKPKEFDFIEHWNLNDKKIIASFFYKIKNRYPNIEEEEYLSYIKYRVFIEYKKKNGNLIVNPSLLGKIRMELYRINKRNLENNQNIKTYSLWYIEEEIVGEYGEIEFMCCLRDIEKICCFKTKDALVKKVMGEELTRNDFKILKKNRDKIIEYFKI